MVGGEPRRIELVVLRRAAEVPDVGIAVAGEERIARELIARPFADHGARRVADVVLSPACSACFSCTASQASSGRREPWLDAMSTAAAMPCGSMLAARN